MIYLRPCQINVLFNRHLIVQNRVGRQVNNVMSLPVSICLLECVIKLPELRWFIIVLVMIVMIGNGRHLNLFVNCQKQCWLGLLNKMLIWHGLSSNRRASNQMSEAGDAKCWPNGVLNAASARSNK